jgi:uncharacterized Zn ribbon protein
MRDVIVRPDEQVVAGAHGVVLREYDDVQLLRSIKSSGAGNVTVDVIPAGTRGTIINALDDNQVQIECYVGPKEFAFALEDAAQLQLVQRREEKLKHA